MTTNGPADGEPIDLLVVESGHLLHHLLQRMLAPYGFALHAARDAEEALDVLSVEANRIVVALVGGAHERVVSALRQRRPDLPVAVASGGVRAQCTVALSGGGLLSLFPKPYPPAAQLAAGLRALATARAG